MKSSSDITVLNDTSAQFVSADLKTDRLESVRHVTVGFKTHLDVGFTDLAEVVIRRYLDVMLPAVLDTGDAVREKARDTLTGSAGFAWTTGSWLINLALRTYDGSRLRRLESAIERNEIIWHALPFTLHTELLDADLFRASLDISKRLDTRFGKKTRTAKMTDVPGHTRAVIPLLVEAGVELLHLGVNPGSAMPNVPSRFRWRSLEGQEIVVVYENDYGDEIVSADGQTAFVLVHAGDNLPPPDLKALEEIYSRLAKRYPNATIRTGGLEALLNLLRDETPQLPTVTAEIGDSWIHGVGTAPQKVSQFMSLCRLRRRLLSEGADPGTLVAFDEKMLLVAEHTWGLDEKTHLGDYMNYARPDFDAARRANDVASNALTRQWQDMAVFYEHRGDEIKERSYSKLESSWAEQHAYIDQARIALSPAHQDRADQAIKACTPLAVAAADAWSSLDTDSTPLVLSAGPYEMRVEPSGAIRPVANNLFQGPWLTARYQALDVHNYHTLLANYNRKADHSWVVADFSKPGLERFDRSALAQYTRLTGFRIGVDCTMAATDWPDATPTGDGFELRLAFKARVASDAKIAAPPDDVVLAVWPSDDGICLDWRWYDKPASRWPEALWLGFGDAPAGNNWTLQKMGQPIDPTNVVRGGGRLHAAEFCRITGDPGGLEIQPLDTPLFTLNPDCLLDPRKAPPVLASRGSWFNVLNNVWGTNFPMWNSGHGRCRFKVRFCSIHNTL